VHDAALLSVSETQWRAVSTKLGATNVPVHRSIVTITPDGW